MSRILVVNGPNLNLLGTRQPDIYGSATLTDVEDACRDWGASLNITVDTFQSNHEGSIIDRLHQARGEADGIIINPGAFTHYSYAIYDALAAVPSATWCTGRPGRRSPFPMVLTPTRLPTCGFPMARDHIRRPS